MQYLTLVINLILNGGITAVMGFSNSIFKWLAPLMSRQDKANPKQYFATLSCPLGITLFVLFP